jgi:hypothetical protein
MYPSTNLHAVITSKTAIFETGIIESSGRTEKKARGDGTVTACAVLKVASWNILVFNV